MSTQKRPIFLQMRNRSMFSPRFLSLLLSSSPCVCHDSYVSIKETCFSTQKRPIFPHMRPMFSPRFLSLFVTSSPYVCLHVTAKETYTSTQKIPIFPHKRDQYFHTRETNISTQKTYVFASLSFSYTLTSSPYVCHDSFIGCAMTRSCV